VKTVLKLPYVIDNQVHRLADVLNDLLSRHKGQSLDVATVEGLRLPVPLRRRLVSWPHSLLEKHYRINEGGQSSAISLGLETKEIGSGDLQK